MPYSFRDILADRKISPFGKLLCLELDNGKTPSRDVKEVAACLGVGIDKVYRARRELIRHQILSNDQHSTREQLLLVNGSPIVGVLDRRGGDPAPAYMAVVRKDIPPPDTASDDDGFPIEDGEDEGLANDADAPTDDGHGGWSASAPAAPVEAAPPGPPARVEETPAAPAIDSSRPRRRR